MPKSKPRSKVRSTQEIVELRERARPAYERGAPVTAIAAMFGVSERYMRKLLTGEHVIPEWYLLTDEQVADVLRSIGFKGKRRKKRTKEETALLRKQVMALHERGARHRDIAKLLGISEEYASNIVNDPDGSRERDYRAKHKRGRCSKCGTPIYGNTVCWACRPRKGVGGRPRKDAAV